LTETTVTGRLLIDGVGVECGSAVQPGAIEHEDAVGRWLTGALRESRDSWPLVEQMAAATSSCHAVTVEQVRIRSAAIVDVSALLSLWREADAEPSVGEDPRSVSDLLDAHPDGVLIAELEGVPIGSLIAVWDGWRGNMYRLAVLPGFRRRGIAQALVAEGERRLRERGCARVSALVLRERNWATGFWTAAGYQLDERVVRFVRNLDEPSPRGNQPRRPAQHPATPAK
jgi:ribosomal protein S18 acetylase RimI-like enzyme